LALRDVSEEVVSSVLDIKGVLKPGTVLTEKERKRLSIFRTKGGEVYDLSTFMTNVGLSFGKNGRR
jgi:hypothetical protein